MRRFLLVPVSATFLVFSLIATATPASAQTTMTHGSDNGTVFSGPSSDYAEVCDIEVDGHGVYVEYQSFGLPGTGKLWDANGSSSGCTTKSIGHATRARLCENTVSCTSWYYEPW
jgi:hypothetical protein